MLSYTATYTDQYQLTMGQTYFLKGKFQQRAVFDYFFRKLPFDGGYVVFAGLQELLEALQKLRFDESDIDFLRSQGFHKDYIAYLENFRFQGEIYAPKEGEIVFPTEPLIRVEANLIEAQLIETLLLNIINFQSLIASKARRIWRAAEGRLLIDFGMRRAQGWASYSASRAAIIGGFHATSHVLAAKDYDIPASGTMAHSFIQCYDDELTAFRDFAESRPDDCILLVDTYNTLKSGLPHAITVAKEMEKRGHRLKGIRLDSGDLAYLAKKSRAMLDQAGLHYVKIVASNQIDEYVIKSLLEQEAPIDAFGVGTSMVVGRPDAALDGVYKLSYSDGKPRIKISENTQKVTLPHRKILYRLLNKNGHFVGADLVALEQEQPLEIMYHPFDPLKSLEVADYEKEALLHKVMENGQILYDPLPLKKIAEYSLQRFALLEDEYKRFTNPHIYKVGISTKLKQERDQLIKHYQEFV